MAARSGSAILSIAAFVLLLFAGVAGLRLMPASAEPYIATRTGFKCGQCHVNRTGGGKRTDFGVVYAQTQLSMDLLRPAEGASSFNGYLSESVSMGANFRSDHVVLFDYASREDDLGTTSSSEITEANLYFEIDLIPGSALLYIDQTLAPNSSNRELFGLIENLPAHSYIKIGRMLLPYGLRLLDNDAFVRSKTGYTYSRQGVGVEVGLEPGPLALIANLTDDQLSVVGSLVFRRVRLGGSIGRSIRRSGDMTFGPFAGLNAGRFTLLGEVDLIDEQGIDQLAALAELNYLVRRGLNVKLTYEFFDRNRDVSNDRDGQERMTLGAEPFIAQFVQAGLFYRTNRFIPQNAAENQDQMILQFHLFF